MQQTFFEDYHIIGSPPSCDRTLRLVEQSETYDIDATLDGGGPAGQAGALRLGIARALIDIDPEQRTTLKAAGLLTRDARRKKARNTVSRKPVRHRSPSGKSRRSRHDVVIRHRWGPARRLSSLTQHLSHASR